MARRRRRAAGAEPPRCLQVLHNLAVAEFYADGCADAERLLGALRQATARSEELVAVAEAQLESAAAPVGGGAGATDELGELAAASAAVMANSDASVPKLNTAVVHHCLHHADQASAIVEPLFRNIEPIDEAAALRVCLLRMDLALDAAQPDKAADVLAYMEKSFAYLLAPDEGRSVAAGAGAAFAPWPPSASQHPALLQSSLGGSGDFGAAVEGTGSVGGTGAGLAPDLPSGRELSEPDEGLDDEALNLSLEIPGAARQRSHAAAATAAAATARASNRQLPASASELRLALHLRRARLLLLTRALKATKREIKAALALARDSLPALLLKGQLDYSRSNHRKAIKQLVAISPAGHSDPALAAAILNNLAAVHHRLGKHQMAAFYFAKALQKSSLYLKQRPVPLVAYARDRSASILYNAGLQLLLHGSPLLALRCLQEAGMQHRSRPLLWLRLAECCIAAYDSNRVELQASGAPCQEAGNGGMQQQQRREKVVTLAIAGDGQWRRVVISADAFTSVCPEGRREEGPGKGGQWLAEGGAEGKGSEAGGDAHSPPPMPLLVGEGAQLSLEYARDCLRLCLYLLNNLDATAVAAAAAAALAVANAADAKEGAAGRREDGGTGPAVAAGEEVWEEEGEVEKKEESEKEGAGSKSISSSSLAAAVAACEEAKARESATVRQCALSCLAYVELCLGCPAAVVDVATRLLQLPSCAKLYNFLGHLYAAEAHCMLDQPSDAAEHLSTCLIEHISTEALPLQPAPLSAGGEDEGQSEASAEGEDGAAAARDYPPSTSAAAASISVLSSSLAQASLYVNLAAVYATQGELLQAQQCALQALSISATNPHAMLAVVYVELCRGHTDDALAMLKHCRHVRVVSGRQPASLFPAAASTLAPPNGGNSATSGGPVAVA
eukprot:SM000056S18000  [mRNA]  locus=s56:617552:622073:+ [translate_table: standard]